MRRLLAVGALAPLLLAFGPGNCAPVVDFAADAAAEDERAAWSQDHLTITAPLGVAVILQCHNGCNTIYVSSHDPDAVFAAATSVRRSIEETEVGVVVGRRQGLHSIDVAVGDLGYTISVNVTAPPVGRVASPVLVIPIGPDDTDIGPDDTEQPR
jgi:hypothetical protein